MQKNLSTEMIPKTMRKVENIVLEKNPHAITLIIGTAREDEHMQIQEAIR